MVNVLVSATNFRIWSHEIEDKHTIISLFIYLNRINTQMLPSTKSASHFKLISRQEIYECRGKKMKQ